MATFYVMELVSLRETGDPLAPGIYFESFDGEMNANINTTDDASAAQRFDSEADVLALWNEAANVEPDPNVNRPLSAYLVKATSVDVTVG